MRQRKRPKAAPAGAKRDVYAPLMSKTKKPKVKPKPAAVAKPVGEPGSASPAVYALPQWTVSQAKNGSWWIVPTTRSWKKPERKRGPYPSIKHACFAIATALAAAARVRHKRRCQSYGLEE